MNRNKHHDKFMAQRKIHTNNRYETDIKYRLICKTRSRIYKTSKGMTKQSSSIYIYIRNRYRSL